MDIFPVINETVPILQGSGMRLSAAAQLALWFMLIPLLVWKPLFWLVNFSILWLKNRLTDKNNYLCIYERHLPAETSARKYKIPSYPVIYHGDIKPRKLTQYLVSLLSPLDLLAIPLKEYLPWHQSDLVGGRLHSTPGQQQGLIIRQYFFLSYVRITFLLKESPKSIDEEWQQYSVRLKDRKDVDVLFSPGHKIMAQRS